MILDISPDVSKHLDNNLNIEGLKDGEIREVHSQSFMSQDMMAAYKKLPESPKFLKDESLFSRKIPNLEFDFKANYEGRSKTIENILTKSHDSLNFQKRSVIPVRNNNHKQNDDLE